MKNGFMSTNAYKKLAIASVIVASTFSARAQLASGPVAKPPYTLLFLRRHPKDSLIRTRLPPRMKTSTSFMRTIRSRTAVAAIVPLSNIARPAKCSASFK
jgi:hypothetical protein